MRKLAIAALVIAASMSTSASALYDPKTDPTRPEYYMNRPTNKPKQSIGRTVQEACKRGGRVGPLGCVSAAAAAGGVGLGLAATGFKPPSGTTEAAAGFAGGCVTGGVIGAGAFSLPGCLLGGALGAAVGYFSADDVPCVDAECKIPLNPDGTVGGGVAKTQQPAGSGEYRCNNTYYGIVAAPGVSVSSLAQTGTICRTDNGNGVYSYQQLVRVPMTFNLAQRTADIGGGPVSYNGGGGGGVTHLNFSAATMRLSFIPYSGGGNAVRAFYTSEGEKVANYCLGNEFCPQYESYYATPDIREGALYFFVGDVYGTPQEVPIIDIQKTNPVPLYSIGWGKGIKEEDLDNPLHDKLVALLARNAWRQAGTAAGEGSYVQTDFVTPADVQASYATAPQDRMTVRDLLRPIADPTAPGGTDEYRIPEPVQTVPAQPGTSTGTQTVTVTETPPASDLDAIAGGGLGDPLEPIKAFISGPLAPYLSASFSVPPGTCPAIDWDMEPWFGWFFNNAPQGGSPGGAPSWLRIQTNLHCVKMEEWRLWIQGFLGILLTISSFRWFFSRGDN